MNEIEILKKESCNLPIQKSKDLLDFSLYCFYSKFYKYTDLALKLIESNSKRDFFFEEKAVQKLEEFSLKNYENIDENKFLLNSIKASVSLIKSKISNSIGNQKESNNENLSINIESSTIQPILHFQLEESLDIKKIITIMKIMKSKINTENTIRIYNSILKVIISYCHEKYDNSNDYFKDGNFHVEVLSTLSELFKNELVFQTHCKNINNIEYVFTFLEDSSILTFENQNLEESSIIQAKIISIMKILSSWPENIDLIKEISLKLIDVFSKLHSINVDNTEQLNSIRFYIQDFLKEIIKLSKI